MYNLIEHSDACSKTSGSLRQQYRDEPALDNNNNTIDCPTKNNNSISFKFTQQITGQTVNRGAKDVEIMVPSNYLSKFWRTLETALINCEFSLHLKLSNDCFLVAATAANQKSKFEITDTKLYVPVATLSP